MDMNDLALEYFQVANTVTAFYVIQSFLFFTAIYKERALLAVLCRRRPLAVFATLMTAVTYAGVIIYCGNMEFLVRVNSETLADKDILWSICFGGMLVRLFVIVSLAVSCAVLIGKLLKPEYAKE